MLGYLNQFFDFNLENIMAMLGIQVAIDAKKL